MKLNQLLLSWSVFISIGLLYPLAHLEYCCLYFPAIGFIGDDGYTVVAILVGI